MPGSACSHDQAFAELLAIHEGFAPLWEAHLRYWDGNRPGITTDFAVYAQYVLGLIEQGNLPELAASLDAIEHLIASGDDEVRYGATVGFLEDLTNQLLVMAPGHARLFASLLKPRAKAFCTALDAFWGTATPGIAPNA